MQRSTPELVHEIGVALAVEARSKAAHMVLAPTVNLHRTPIGGRNFECISEDPLLTTRIASAYIRGVQSPVEGHRVACCVKHFIANDTEFERHTISSEVDEVTLRELYMVPVEVAVKPAALQARDVIVVHEPGCHIDKRLRAMRGDFSVHYRGVDGETADPTTDRLNFVWLENPAPNIDHSAFGVTVEGTFTPNVTGDWLLALTAVGSATLRIDGQLIVSLLHLELKYRLSSISIRERSVAGMSPRTTGWLHRANTKFFLAGQPPNSLT